MILRLQKLGCILTLGLCLGQNPPHANYDESQVGNFALPAVLRTSQGDQIRDTLSWRTRRLPEILDFFEGHVFGAVGRPLQAQSVAEIGRGTFAGGLGTWRELRLTMGDRQAFLLIAFLLTAT